MLETAETEPEALYESVSPLLPLGLPFAPTTVSEDWFGWPALPDLFPASFPGVKPTETRFWLILIPGRLKARIVDYFDAKLSHDEIARRYPIGDETVRRASTLGQPAMLLMSEAAK